MFGLFKTYKESKYTGGCLFISLASRNFDKCISCCGTVISAFEESSVWFHSRCVASGRATADINKQCVRCEKLLKKTDSIDRVKIYGEFKAIHRDSGIKRKFSESDSEQKYLTALLTALFTALLN